MPRRPAKLSNCYVPLPLPSHIETADTSNEIHAVSSSKKRADGRSAGHELRQLCLETSVISRALGSSLVELGHTKVLAEANIAAANLLRNNNNNGSNNIGNNEATTDIGSLKSNVKYAPNVGINQISQQSSSVTPLDGNSNSNSTSSTNTTAFATISAGKLNQELAMLEADLSHSLTAALLPVVILERYPKCTVVLDVTVLQDDGSCLSAAITAASMALVDARVELRDMVTSCTVAVVEKPSNSNKSSGDAMDEDDDSSDDEDDRWLYLADPTERETMAISTDQDGRTSASPALICLAMTPNHKEVTLWSQTGRMSSEMASQAMKLCRDGCRTMHKFMRESWMTSESSTGSDDAEMAHQ